VDNFQRKVGQVEWEKWYTTKSDSDCTHRIAFTQVNPHESVSNPEIAR